MQFLQNLRGGSMELNMKNPGLIHLWVLLELPSLILETYGFKKYYPGLDRYFGCKQAQLDFSCIVELWFSLQAN